MALTLSPVKITSSVTGQKNTSTAFVFTSLGASGRYAQYSGNSITLPAGTWRIVGQGMLHSAGGSIAGRYENSCFGSANGANSSSQPTLLSATSGVTVLSGYEQASTGGNFDSFNNPSGTSDHIMNSVPLEVVVRLTTSVTVYFNTSCGYNSTPGSISSVVQIYAERIL